MFASKPISLLNMVVSISSAIDLIDSNISGHHTTVAYIANEIARVLELPQQTQYDIVLAGLLHDIGMLSVPDTQRQANPSHAATHRHGEIGYQLLRKFRHFTSVAGIIRDHHTEWRSRRWSGRPIAPESPILHLADQVDILIDKDKPILEQVDRIVARIAHGAGEQFAPAHVDAFTELAWKEHFWLDIASPSLRSVLLNNCNNYSIDLNGDDLIDFAEMFAHVIDFRCRFTATHSSGVAAVASVIANLIGFSDVECRKIQVAGYLHDIGKLAVPQELLEKPTSLSGTEYRIIKSHAYHTYRILEPLQGLDDVRTWAAMHHERADGYGYPGRLKAHQLSLGSRIMAVADVFTALLEQRPYRDAMSKEKTIAILDGLARRHVVDRNVANVLLSHFDDINTYREQAQSAARAEYEQFLRSVAADSGADAITYFPPTSKRGLL